MGAAEDNGISDGRLSFGVGEESLSLSSDPTSISTVSEFDLLLEGLFLLVDETDVRSYVLRSKHYHL